MAQNLRVQSQEAKLLQQSHHQHQHDIVNNANMVRKQQSATNVYDNSTAQSTNTFTQHQLQMQMPLTPSHEGQLEQSMIQDFLNTVPVQ